MIPDDARCKLLTSIGLCVVVGVVVVGVVVVVVVVVVVGVDVVVVVVVVVVGSIKKSHKNITIKVSFHTFYISLLILISTFQKF